MRHPLFALRAPDAPARVIAHRGGPALAPENTLPAIRIAKTLHVDGVEVDVRAGRRGEVIVIHDATLERTTSGGGRADRYSAAGLRRFDAGRKFDRRFHRAYVPTLREAMAEARPLPLIIEVKEEALMARTLGEVVKARAQARACVMSFHTAGLLAVRKRYSRVAVGHLVKLGWGGRWWGNAQAVVEQALDLGASFLAVDRQGCTARLVRHAHRAHLPVWVWTVDEVAQADRLMKIGVDALITNHPILMLGRMAQWKEWLEHGG